MHRQYTNNTRTHNIIMFSHVRLPITSFLLVSIEWQTQTRGCYVLQQGSSYRNYIQRSRILTSHVAVVWWHHSRLARSRICALACVHVTCTCGCIVRVHYDTKPKEMLASVRVSSLEKKVNIRIFNATYRWRNIVKFDSNKDCRSRHSPRSSYESTQ